MNYQFNSYVNKKEAEALKEMIFRRVRERAQSMTDDVQADVMSIARESFTSKGNPFAQLINMPLEAEAAQNEKAAKPQETKTSALHEFVEAAEAKAQEIGFPQRNEMQIVTSQNKAIQEQASARNIQTTMKEAREGLSNRKSFMGALEFLNSQAAVSLLNKRSRGLEIVA